MLKMLKRNSDVVLLVVVVIAFAFFLTVLCKGNRNYDPGRKVHVKWTEVNVRQGHSLSEQEFCSLKKEDVVTLTGETYEFWGGNDCPGENWTEVELSDGKVGWVVTESIQW